MSIFKIDLLERVLWTFAQGFAAAWIVVEDAGFDSLFSTTNLKVGVAAGAVALAKGVLLGKAIGDKDSAATLPSPPDVAGDNLVPADDRLALEKALLEQTDNRPGPDDPHPPGE